MAQDLNPIYLAGPTASGKSALALALAECLPLEIISVDSALVYRGMDIGTAKPSAVEQSRVRHHLIDIREPDQPYSAADFARDARTLIPQIQARGRRPLLVGGTLLYFRALLQGLDELPAADTAVRQRLAERAERKGWPALHAELARVDPAAAARLPPGDRQRILRALEVWEITGQPLSSLQTKAEDARQAPLHFFSLEPSDRGWLHQRINQRFDRMLADGLVAEVKALYQGRGLSPELPAMRCVGYRQVVDSLDDRQPWATLAARGAAATRQLAKRQLTWLRRMAARTVLPVGPGTENAQLLQAVLRQLDN